MADDSERKFRKLQNYLCLQVLDGEAKMFERKGQAHGIKLSLDVTLEQEREKRKAFQFPEAGKFKSEDDVFFGELLF